MKHKKNILILAEGYEEKYYIEKIVNFPFIKDNYIFSPIINLKGNGKILARYQYEFQTNRHDLILVFADADEGSNQFIEIIEKLGLRIFGDATKGKLVFMFVNPVTLQIVLSHFGVVKLLNKSKKENSKFVFDYTGIDNYDAKEEQIKEMIDGIYYQSIDGFKRRLSKISNNFEDIPSTNFLLFLERFESDDTSWIDDINSLKKK